jgi:hypothetical protein
MVTEEVRCLQSVGDDASKKEHLYDLAVDGKIILKWVLREFDRMVWAGMIKIRTGTKCFIFAR